MKFSVNSPIIYAIIAAIIALVLAQSIFFLVPALNASTVGIMVPVGVVFTVIVAKILYKKGVL